MCGFRLFVGQYKHYKMTFWALLYLPHNFQSLCLGIDKTDEVAVLVHISFTWKFWVYIEQPLKWIVLLW